MVIVKVEGPINEAGLSKEDIEEIDGYIPAENLLSMIEDLLCEIDSLEEKYKDFEKYVEDNYRHLTYEEQIDYNPDDFYTIYELNNEKNVYSIIDINEE